MNILKSPCDEGVIAAHKAGAPCGKARGRWILAATILGSSMVFIDGTVVNVALPALQSSLNATAIDVQWVVEALFLAALLLLGGPCCLQASLFRAAYTTLNTITRSCTAWRSVSRR